MFVFGKLDPLDFFKKVSRMSIRRYIKMAKNTLSREFKRYIAFFVAIFLLQAVFCTLICVRANYARSQERYLSAKYVNDNGLTYHLRLLSLTSEQYAMLTQFESAQTDENKFFSIVGGTISTGSLTTGTKYKIYDVELAFDSETMKISDAYDLFSESYYPSLGDFGEYKTPLLDYAIESALYSVSTVIMVMLVLGVAVVILSVLFGVLSPCYRFDYGIYMSFGAGSSKLFSIAATEQIIINLLVFLPSMILSNVVSAVMITNSGLDFSLFIPAIVFSLILSLASSLSAAFIYFRKTAKEAPISLLSSEDNSDIIASPKTSTNILSCVFPRGLEKLSLRRFKKYIACLNIFALAFSLLFTFASCLASSREKAENMPMFQYELTFVPTIERVKVDESGQIVSDDDVGEYETIEITTYGGSYDSEMSSFVNSIEGITAVYKESSVCAYECNSHVLLDSRAVAADVGALKFGNEKGLLDVDYHALDSEVASWLTYCGYSIDGSLDDVIADPSMIAISDSLNNHRKIKLKVGDTVRIAVDSRLVGSVPELVLGGNMNGFLEDMLDNYSYRYKTYTVGAVISDMPSDSSLEVFMSDETYRIVTGRDVVYSSAKLVVDPDIDEDTLELIGINMRYAEDFCDNLIVNDLDGLTKKAVAANKNIPDLLGFFAVSALLVVPIMTAVSLVIFYRKRSSEFDAYYALGAVKEDIAGLFRTDAIVFGLSSTISYLVLGTAVSLLVWLGVNTDVGESIIYLGESICRIDYTFPIGVLFLGALFTAGGVFLGIYLSMKSALGRYKTKVGDINECNS